MNRRKMDFEQKGISAEMAWMKDTRWLWNEWREVIFRADGSFLAPAENCERPGNPNCNWTADDEKIYVKCALRAAAPAGPAPSTRALPPPRLLPER